MQTAESHADCSPMPKYSIGRYHLLGKAWEKGKKAGMADEQKAITGNKQTKKGIP